MRAPFPQHYLITPEPATYGRVIASSDTSSGKAATPSEQTAAWLRETAASSEDAASSSTSYADDRELPFQRFLQDMEASLAAGIKLVQLRSKLLTPIAFAALAKQAAILCHRAGARLILNGALDAWYHGHPYAALQAGIDEHHADGVHLSSAQLMRCAKRPLRQGQWVSAACHSLAELQQAMALQLDFVTLSPVRHTATHPDAEPLGWPRLAALARAVDIPIFALGGMQAADMALAHAHGAHGIAAIRSFWVRKSA